MLVINRNVQLKDKYAIESQYYCSPISYNAKAFNMPLGPSMHPKIQEGIVFSAWNEYINIEKSRPLLKLLKKHYEIPIFTQSIEYPGLPSLYGVVPVREALNTVFQAKYGFFSCARSQQYIGQVNYNTDLICMWESSAKSLDDLWYLAIAYALK